MVTTKQKERFQEEVRDFIVKWAPRLGITHWDIAVILDCDTPAEQCDRYAQVEISDHNEAVDITYFVALILRDMKRKRDREEITVHELLHVLLDKCVPDVGSVPAEQVAHRISRILVGVL